MDQYFCLILRKYKCPDIRFVTGAQKMFLGPIDLDLGSKNIFWSPR
jgi:hypothetical protein